MLTGAFCAAFVCAAAALLSVAVLRSRGLLPEPQPDRFGYPLRGAYVSERCGEIDWKLFSQGSSDFCYIRLTAGTAFADRLGKKNLGAALHSGLAAGAVHDIGFYQDGRAQADNFLSAVGEYRGLLIPALDIRMSLADRIRFRDSSRIKRTVAAFVGRLTEATGRGALLLCDEYSFKLLGLGQSGADIWAECSADDRFCESPVMISYSEGGRSSALREKDKTFTITAARSELTATDRPSGQQ